MLNRILVYIAAVVSLAVAAISLIGSREQRKKYEDTLEVSKKINSDQRTGNVRDRMRKYVRKDGT